MVTLIALEENKAKITIKEIVIGETKQPITDKEQIEITNEETTKETAPVETDSNSFLIWSLIIVLALIIVLVIIFKKPKHKHHYHKKF
jgi:flagellar biogenesis protein FliO